MTMKKIGIMGGTFDPIHNGHIMLGRQAYEEYDLDCIWYMPSRIPPHKKGSYDHSGKGPFGNDCSCDRAVSLF